MRPSWVQYYKHTDAIIMVIDSTDRARISIVKVQLGACLLVMAYSGKESQGLSDITCCTCTSTLTPKDPREQLSLN